MSILPEALLDWAATGASTTGVFASLFVHDVLQRVAFLAGPVAHQRVVSDMAMWINRATTLSGARFVVEGLEHVEPGRGYIVVSNHQSLLDISMASDFLRRLAPRYISKIELAKGIPGVSLNLARGGSVCIDRKDPAQAHAAIQAIAGKVANEGMSVVIFPEGTRSRSGAMRPFKPGGLRTLIENAPGVPILPVTTWGGSRLFSRKLKPIVRGVELGFHVHPPRSAPSPSDEEAFASFLGELWATIESALPARDREGRAAEG